MSRARAGRRAKSKAGLGVFWLLVALVASGAARTGVWRWVIVAGLGAVLGGWVVREVARRVRQHAEPLPVRRPPRAGRRPVPGRPLLADRPTQLYRHWWGTWVIYVGIAAVDQFGTRQATHAERSWWARVPGGVVTAVTAHPADLYPDRATALAAERDAIIAEDPPCNYQHRVPGAWQPCSVAELDLGLRAGLCRGQGGALRRAG